MNKGEKGQKSVLCVETLYIYVYGVIYATVLDTDLLWKGGKVLVL